MNEYLIDILSHDKGYYTDDLKRHLRQLYELKGIKEIQIDIDDCKNNNYEYMLSYYNIDAYSSYPHMGIRVYLEDEVCISIRLNLFITTGFLFKRKLKLMPKITMSYPGKGKRTFIEITPQDVRNLTLAHMFKYENLEKIVRIIVKENYFRFAPRVLKYFGV